MKITYLTIFCFISLNIFSQNLKKYDGEYKNGKASYEYYEDENYERKYQGEFKYENDEVNFNTVVFGSFQNNLQIGEWYYKRFHKHSSNSIIILGNYKNGRKNGTWSYNQISESSLNEKKEDRIKQDIYFIELREDTLINNFSLKNVNGQFNNKGHFIGKWIASKEDYEYIAEFKNNTLIKLIERKKSTGKIISKYIPQNIQWDKENFYTKFTKNKLDIYGLQTNYDEKAEQIRSINRFFKLIDKEFNPFNSFNYVFLKNINIKSPQFIFKKEEKIPLKEKEEIKTKQPVENRILKVKIKQQIEKDKCNEEGTVMIKVKINDKGKVISLIAGVKGTTNTSRCLIEIAKKTAYSTNAFESNKTNIRNGIIEFKSIIRN